MKYRLPLLHPSRLCPLAAMILGLGLPSASGVEVLLTDDSTVYSGSSAATQGDAAVMTVNSTSTKCAVMRFEIASMLPAGLTADNIATATLRLYTADTPTGSGTIDIYTVKTSKSWNEGNAAGVWVSGTDYNATPVVSGVGVGNFSLKDFTAIDLTSTVKSWITTPSSNNGIIVRPSGTIGLTFQTKEASTICHHATLDITLKGDVGENPTYSNTTYGVDALHSVTTGPYNVAAGYQALYSDTTGGNNIGIGYQALFLNTYQGGNVAIGYKALRANIDGGANIAIGDQVLLSNTTGSYNIGLGWNSLAANTTGFQNIAIGAYALNTQTSSNSNVAVGDAALAATTTGSGNVAIGKGTLTTNTSGDYNVAYGNQALSQCTTGFNNIGIGLQAGLNVTTENNNILLGAHNYGVAGESKTIRVGVQGTHTDTYIAGISGVTASGGVAIYVNANGKLGTLTSSRRFKEDITEMGRSSEAILALRPVNFHYLKKIDEEATPQYGLIAEEVAEIAPELVAHDDKGDIYSVRYEAVNAMLLNEFQKEHKRVEAQAIAIARQQGQIERLTESIAELTRRLSVPARNK